MTVEIFLDDLKEDARKQVLHALGIASPEDGNYDIIPLFVLTTEEDGGE